MRLDLLSDYAIPYLHPLAVHFPLVLLLLAAGAAVLYAALGRPVWRQAALGLLLLGTAGAKWAEETGETLEHDVEGEPIVEAVLPTHQAMAEWTLRFGLLASVAFAGVTLWLRRRRPHLDVADPASRGTPREPLVARLVPLLPALAAAVFVAWTAHLGGIMVWGVPVGP